MIVNNELKLMWKEAVVASLIIPFLEQSEENHEKSSGY
jgi:hypothetical protein